jgi:hypothetical protein
LGCEIWLTKLYNDIKALYACKNCVQGNGLESGWKSQGITRN